MVKILDFGLAKATREEKVDGGLTDDGPDARHARLHRPRADPRRPEGRHPGRHLQPGLHPLLPPDRRAAVPRRRASTTSSRPTISIDASPLNLVRPEVPAELAALVAKMMAKEPGRRFQTPAEVARALTPFKRAGRPQGAQAGRDPDRAPAGSRRARSGPRGRAPGIPVRQTEGRNPRPESMWESLIDLREAERPVGRGPAVAPTRRPPWIWPSAAAGVLVLGFIVAWAAGVFKVKTQGGMIVLENVPEQAEVFVDGEKVTVQWPRSGEPLEITVPAGKHEVRVKKDGFKTFGGR